MTHVQFNDLVLAASPNDIEFDESHPTEVSTRCTLNYICLQDGFVALDFIAPYPGVPTVYSSFQTPKYPEPEPENSVGSTKDAHGGMGSRVRRRRIEVFQVHVCQKLWILKEVGTDKDSVQIGSARNLYDRWLWSTLRSSSTKRV
ncbi:hypothetical protein K435DRAFT_791285 [Dendrothele bispora CBS 962.96]|uniref:Uncharacterized protein n=1 Tax=Dendrothele bispora (strain CBS 962.96) TaxID=1314807 RepID=A0A4S8MML3_DENBC|nr:hypothetical protein K435DRAFT_791285 [Dendrothele bispora CBS 962.96]